MPPDPGATARVAAAPTGYAGLLRSREYVGLLLSRVISLVGDQLARVALAVLVFERTRSPLLSALTYAATFLPVVIGGPLLGGLADRLPRRRLLVLADLLRAALFAVMAVPGLPLWLLLALVLLASLVEAPWVAARAPLLREVLVDEGGYQRGSSIDEALDQSGQVVGFLGAGALLLVLRPEGALLLDAASFLVSALVVRLLVLERPPPQTGPASTLADVRAGVRAAFAPGARRPLLLTLGGLSLSIAPEALAVPYAVELGGGPGTAGLLLAMNPVGTVIGLLLLGRLTPERSRGLAVPLAGLTLAPLLLLLTHPPLVLALLVVLVSGTASSYSLLTRVAFVEAVPAAVRGRAFAVAASALSAGQGLGIALAGAVAVGTLPSTSVALSAGLGLVLVALAVVSEPVARR